MKLTADAKGTFAIAPTPFHDDGRIDERSIDRLTDFYEEVGCDGVTVLGILGEAPKLDAAEAVGTDVPFVLQDYPLAIGVVMTPGVIRRIVQDNPSCVMLKHEDWPGLEKISALRGFEKDGSMRHVSILTGNGGLFLDFEMERGADGAMTGYCFPDMLVDVVRLSKAGQRDKAHDLFDAHLPLVRYEQQQGVGLAVRKYVMMRRGVLASDAQRKPAGMLSSTAKAEVDYLLSRLGRSDQRALKLAA